MTHLKRILSILRVRRNFLTKKKCVDVIDLAIYHLHTNYFKFHMCKIQNTFCICVPYGVQFQQNTFPFSLISFFLPTFLCVGGLFYV